MKVWMLWHGGSNYAAGSIEDDIEEFESLNAAKLEFDSRADSWRTYYPCVERTPAEDGGQSAWIYFYDPRVSNENDPTNSGDPYPNRLLEYGKRGGLHVRYT